MANDFLVLKWKLWFSWFDFNMDGKVNTLDLEIARNRFANLYHSDSERKKAALDTYTLWWSKYLMWEKSEIMEDEFIEYQSKAFSTNKEEFIKRMNESQTIVCNLIDADGDGLITLDNLIMLSKSTEHKDEAVIKRWFNAHGPVGGKVPVQKMINMRVQFLTEDDSSKPDVIVEQYEISI